MFIIEESQVLSDKTLDRCCVTDSIVYNDPIIFQIDAKIYFSHYDFIDNTMCK
jgi:hypothetical protein